MRDLARLATLLVVSVRMPVDRRMEAQEPHSEDERYAHQTQDDSFRHAQTDPTSTLILTRMFFRGQGEFSVSRRNYDEDQQY